MTFEELHLNPALLAAVAAEGYTVPTTIQQQAIPHVLAGRDIVGLAQTGTGKTAAFALPILHRLMAAPAQGHRHIRVLVLAPTRELASQIEDSFQSYGRGAGQRTAVIFGGVGQERQTRALKEGIDILVATPGRLLDLMGQGYVDLNHVEAFVLDEADRMLDMGFIHDVRKIVAKIPKVRQTMLFSATMPRDVKELADSLLKDPKRVEAHAVSSTVDRIEQSVYRCDRGRKRALLLHLMSDPAVTRALVFTRTKQGANRVTEFLNKSSVRAEAIHGNKSQGARERALANFVDGRTRCLVATDIAARGIDIDGISHIINFEVPNIPETYVHRIGRTARAGAAGVAVSFADGEEQGYIRDIERLIGKPIPRAPMPTNLPEPPPAANLPHTTSRPAQPHRHEQRPQGRPSHPPNRPAQHRHGGGGGGGGPSHRPAQQQGHGGGGGGPSHRPAQGHGGGGGSSHRPPAPAHPPQHSPRPATPGAMRPESHSRPFGSRGRG